MEDPVKQALLEGANREVRVTPQHFRFLLVRPELVYLLGKAGKGNGFGGFDEFHGFCVGRGALNVANEPIITEVSRP